MFFQSAIESISRTLVEKMSALGITSRENVGKLQQLFIELEVSKNICLPHISQHSYRIVYQELLRRVETNRTLLVGTLLLDLFLYRDCYVINVTGLCILSLVLKPTPLALLGDIIFLQKHSSFCFSDLILWRTPRLCMIKDLFDALGF